MTPPGLATRRAVRAEFNSNTAVDAASAPKRHPRWHASRPCFSSRERCGKQSTPSNIETCGLSRRSLGAELAADVQARHRKIDVVAPVPLHRRRLRARGYNQAELLARPVAARLGVPMSTDLLSRVSDNPPQAQARNEAARSAAVRNAFAASSEALGKRGAADRRRRNNLQHPERPAEGPCAG